jgi:hypothetical protein
MCVSECVIYICMLYFVYCIVKWSTNQINNEMTLTFDVVDNNCNLYFFLRTHRKWNQIISRTCALCIVVVVITFHGEKKKIPKQQKEKIKQKKKKNEEERRKKKFNKRTKF